VCCVLLGSQQWFVLENLNAASSVYHVKLCAVNGRGVGQASDSIAFSTVVITGRQLSYFQFSLSLYSTFTIICKAVTHLWVLSHS